VAETLHKTDRLVFTREPRRTAPSRAIPGPSPRGAHRRDDARSYRWLPARGSCWWWLPARPNSIVPNSTSAPPRSGGMPRTFVPGIRRAVEEPHERVWGHFVVSARLWILAPAFQAAWGTSPLYFAEELTLDDSPATAVTAMESRPRWKAGNWRRREQTHLRFGGVDASVRGDGAPRFRFWSYPVITTLAEGAGVSCSPPRLPTFQRGRDLHGGIALCLSAAASNGCCGANTSA